MPAFNAFSIDIGLHDGDHMIFVMSATDIQSQFNWMSVAMARNYAKLLNTLADQLDPPQQALVQEQPKAKPDLWSWEKKSRKKLDVTPAQRKAISNKQAAMREDMLKAQRAYNRRAK